MSRTFASTDNAAELGQQDYVIIGLKAHTIDEAVDAMQSRYSDRRPASSPRAMASPIGTSMAMSGSPVCIFNSIDPGGRQWDRLAPERAIGRRRRFRQPRSSRPGSYRHESMDADFRSGEPGGQKTPRVRCCTRRWWQAASKRPSAEDIRDEIWLKLCGNLCFNPISALTLATIDVIAGDPGTRADLPGDDARGEGDRRLPRALRLRGRYRAAHRRRGRAREPHKMSMLQDLERGRSMEDRAAGRCRQGLGRIPACRRRTTDVVLALIRQRAQAR